MPQLALTLDLDGLDPERVEESCFEFGALAVSYTDKFDDPNLPGQMQTTVSLKKVSCGTELTVVQEGIPSAIPVEACYLGWQESLTLLAKLVEAEIPG